jgi:hypothetical protein
MPAFPRLGTRRLALCRCFGVSALLAAAACSDFLAGPGLGDDPRNITTLTQPGPLYVAVQRRAADVHELQQAPMMYMQQIAGIGRGATNADAYGIAPTEQDPFFFFVYVSSGLLDMRKVQQLGRAAGDSLYIGLAKVYEALNIGLAADVWGDVPYREAADSNNPTPRYDPQLQVYADIQAQLDSAINLFLRAEGPTNAGPTADGSELVYGGRSAEELRAVYSAVARSLKARFFLHVAAASRAGVSGAPPAAYDSAFKYAQAGIGSTADDLLWFHSAAGGEQNPWWGYPWLGTPSAGDLAPAAAIIELLNRRIAEGVEDEQRIGFYFAPASDGEFHGFRPTGAVVETSGGIDDGSGPYSTFGSYLDQGTSDGSFRPPEITYAETQLIAAEAAWQLNCAGCSPETVVGAAQPFLDNARRGRRYGSSGEGPVDFGDAPGVLPASLRNIIEEKYVTLFMNPEIWNDWKRTCLPSLAPAPDRVGIPGRLPYAQGEYTANTNVPATSSTGSTITSVSLNPNQPAACPALNYTSSNPLAN